MGLTNFFNLIGLLPWPPLGKPRPTALLIGLSVNSMSLILLPNPIQNMIESYYWSVQQHSTKFTDIGIPRFREFSSN
jgi:hypothetical protein